MKRHSKASKVDVKRDQSLQQGSYGEPFGAACTKIVLTESGKFCVPDILLKQRTLNESTVALLTESEGYY